MFLSYQAPSGVLFLVDDGTLRILADDGREALVPWPDFVSFLLQLSRQGVDALKRFKPHQLQALALALQSWDVHPGFVQ